MSTSDLQPFIPSGSPDFDFANGLDSLPSSPTTSSSLDDDFDESDAEREWKESLKQLELLLTIVVVPYLGKYFGRKCAYWGKCTHLFLSSLMHVETAKEGAAGWGREAMLLLDCRNISAKMI